MRPGVLRLLPLPLGLAGGLLGGVLWWLLLALNPETWNDLDEGEAYVVFATVFMGWGLVLGCLYAFVPPFAKLDPARSAVLYRLRRAIWLYALPMLALWVAAIAVAVFVSQQQRIDEELAIALIFPATLAGAAWITQEACDWIRPRLPSALGALAAAAAIVVLSLSLGTIVIMATPAIWELFFPQGNPTAMDAAIDLLRSDLEGYSYLMMGPAVHGATLALMVPTCELLWRVPRPRRRELGGTPYLLLAIPVLALFDLLAVMLHGRW